MNLIALKVKFNNQICGALAKIIFDNGEHTFMFHYDVDYLLDEASPAISLSLPKRSKPFYSHQLFGFFDNMIAEGWLKREQTKLQRIDEDDHFSLLLNNGQDLPGAVTVIYDEQLSNLLKDNFKIQIP